MKRHQLLSLMLTLCMVFSTSASAFLHFGEHQHEQTHSANQLDIHEHQHDNYDAESDHAHHFNLHVVGDLVEFESPSLIRSLSLASCDYSSQLISRSYSPPLPPPNV